MADMEHIIACPACVAPMRNEIFERKYGGTLTLDICVDCKQIWFDEYESAQLAPDGLLKLFKLINDNRGTASNNATDSVDCPRCSAPLILTHDLQRNNRLLYFRCEAGHGRLTAFYQFLREKNFVRDLTPAEVGQLKAEVKQVRCAGCGAPVDLQRESACSFCKAPISILDGNAVAIALRELDAARSGARQMNPAHTDLPYLLHVRGNSSAGGTAWQPVTAGPSLYAPEDGTTVFDLVGTGIGLIASWFDD